MRHYISAKKFYNTLKNITQLFFLLHIMNKLISLPLLRTVCSYTRIQIPYLRQRDSLICEDRVQIRKQSLCLHSNRCLPLDAHLVENYNLDKIKDLLFIINFIIL